eukprot:15829_1
MQCVMKQLVLVYFRLIKLALNFVVLMAIINELFIICNAESFVIGAALQDMAPITAQTMLNHLSSFKTTVAADSFFRSHSAKRDLANLASAANDTLDSVKLFDFGSIPKTHSNDAYCKDGSWHVWKPIPEYPTVKFYYLDGGECIISSIAGFMIPIHKEGNVLQNKCFCTSLWDYLMDTIACAPAYSNMMVGGSSSSSNTAAELVNRYLKYIEGFKYMRVDNYLNMRFTTYYKLIKSFLLRFRKQIANRYCKCPGMQDFWNGSGHEKSAESAFSVAVCKAFDLLVRHEKALKLTMNPKKLLKQIMIILDNDGLQINLISTASCLVPW